MLSIKKMMKKVIVIIFAIFFEYFFVNKFIKYIILLNAYFNQTNLIICLTRNYSLSNNIFLQTFFYCSL